MRVVAIASRKGGSGKTTLAGHLAVQAELSGHGPVAVVDIDPQGSLADWWNARSAESPLFVQTTSDHLARDLEALRAHGVRYLFLDTPPALSPTIAEVVRLSDLILVPSRPSPHDLRSVGATVELVEHLGKPLIFVINGATPRARITSEAIEVLSQYGPMAPTIVHQRVDFAVSMIDGRTAMELPGQTRSAEEIAQLWEFLRERLEGGYQRRGLPPRPSAAAGNGGLTAHGVSSRELS